jgi:hypothetical protein
MPKVDYLSLFTKEIEAMMDQHVEQARRMPRTVLMPKSAYVLLQDYCIAREQQIYVELLLQRAQAPTAMQGRIDAKIRMSQTRRQHLAAQGVHSLSCKYGLVPVQMRKELEEIEIQ